MRLSRHATLAALSGSLLTGAVACAHTAAAPSSPASPTESVVTGSHLPQPVDPATGQATTPSILRSYGSDQLQQTGRTQPGDAVQQLDPAVQRP